ncbi:hypothetical protein DSECCO2_602800 [anaerobic digester metagenome]
MQRCCRLGDDDREPLRRLGAEEARDHVVRELHREPGERVQGRGRRDEHVPTEREDEEQEHVVERDRPLTGVTGPEVRRVSPLLPVKDHRDAVFQPVDGPDLGEDEDHQREQKGDHEEV